MKFNHIVRGAGIFLGFIALLGFVLFPVQANTPDVKRPKVALIKADWCGACKRLEPTMKELMREYKDRIDFVVFDVTNDETSAEAAARADELGLAKVFEDNKRKTSTVVVLSPDNEIIFQTSKNFDRNAYVNAFDEALAKT